MRLITFLSGGSMAAGYVDGDDAVACVQGAAAERGVLDLIAEGPDGLARWRDMGASAPRAPLAGVSLLAPIPRPLRDVFCVGKNYRAHAAEFHGSGFDSSGKEAVPSSPVVFTKATTSVVGPGAEVRASLDPTASVDYEGELAVIIGPKAFQVPASRAMEHVFGYAALNDVTSRELQKKHNQWVIGKSIDTFCPMGPWLVTADEAGDPAAMTLETRVNGEIRQKASVADLIFDIPFLIETLSRTMTLLPGDIIATGTPEGVGIGSTPPRYLRPGDRVAVTISGLGTLENPIV